MEQPMDVASTLLDRIRCARSIGYGRMPLPSTMDGEIATLINAVIDADAYPEVDRKLGEVEAETFWVFSKRAASLSVRESDRDLILVGLVALAWGGLGNSQQYANWRDALGVLSLHYRSAELIGADPEPLFRQAVGIDGEPAAAAYIEYLSRENPTIAQMWYRESQDGQGRFLYTQLPP